MSINEKEKQSYFFPTIQNAGFGAQDRGVAKKPSRLDSLQKISKLTRV